MRQTIHILNKDIRHLWVLIVIVWVLFVLHAVFDVLSWPLLYNDQARTLNTIAIVLKFLLPIGIWFLVASAVFLEVLPGDRQFWITRPYTRGKLLAAKVLLVLVFVNLPLFVSDCCILGAQGFPVLSVLGKIFERQLMVPLVFVLPAFAIAVVTTGMSQFVLAWLLALVALVLQSVLASVLMRSQSVGLEVQNGAPILWYFAISCCAVIIWQYLTRRTTPARIVIASTVLGTIPFLWGFNYVCVRVGPRRVPGTGPGSIQITYDLNRHSTFPTETQPANMTRLRIALEVTGVPRGQLLRGTGNVSVTANGKTWPKPGTYFVGSIERIQNRYRQTLSLWSEAREIGSASVDIHSTLDLDLVTDESVKRVPVSEDWFRVPDAGLCRNFRPETNGVYLTCRSGLDRRVETDVFFEKPGTEALPVGSFGVGAIPVGFSPTTDAPVSPGLTDLAEGQLAFIPRWPLENFERTLDLHGIRLSDYIVGPAQPVH